MSMYQEPSGSPPGGCRETLLLTRIAFGVLLPPLLAIAAVMVLLIVGFVLFTTHPLLGLLPLIPLGAALAWIAKRDRDNPRDPGDHDLPF